ncbi:hypothetical protein EDEG_02382 [Edhazardia aedis USNM 41457]|uniref:Ribulose-phosphate 3-epimerase n=1 Tax=Edhazardia aedis (strain USNM 41457) TaxID=1003232 RepID=J9DKZ1_EDHAE|nr:hypothetical protein EDEG_02382 [Edhazardia aedis USNM 41457]|eukprot:EJW03260.1 hypothetical protein EDEG_02382 [Edhazardia aedis USNM 41457]
MNYDFNFDIHIMVNSPINIIKKLNLTNKTTVIVHNECGGVEESVNFLKSLNIPVGIAFNPESDISLRYHEIVKKILLMTVIPGFGGQKMIKKCVNKIDVVKRIYNDNVFVGVDGGVNLKTIHMISKSDFFVVGSEFFRSVDKGSYILDLKREYYRNK